MAGCVVPGEGRGLGGMSGRVHRALPCQHQVGEELPPGDVLEFPMESLLGDLSLEEEEWC